MRSAGIVAAASVAAALLWACSRFSSSNGVETDAGYDTDAMADGEAPDPGTTDAAESDAVSYFRCLPPDTRCVLSKQACCIDFGLCVGLDEGCPDGSVAQAFCHHRSECQELLDASDAVCCLSQNTTFACQRGPCGQFAVEACLLGAAESECTDPSKNCTLYYKGYATCQ